MTLSEVVKVLRKAYGPPERPPTTDPFELVLLENVAYLAPPARRIEAFEALKAKIGTSPAAILGASRRALESVTTRGILKATFASRLQECARIAVEKFGGDVGAALRDRPTDAAARALRAFPGIGEPGADKILLFTGRDARLSPESNGLRVLVRLGLVREEKSYAKTYAGSRAAARTLTAKVSIFQAAHLLLQQHGRTLCKRTAPSCTVCPLARKCAYALASLGT